MQGFGTAVKVQVPFEWSVQEIRGVNGVHLMSDGVAGEISETPQGVSDKKQFGVCLLGTGAMDPSYGNSSASVAKVNLRVPLGVTQSPWTSGSMMKSDGAVIQVGLIKSNNVKSENNIFLLR